MSRHLRPAMAGLIVIGAVLAVVIGSASASSPSRTAKAAAVQTVSMVEGTAPQSLDPGLDYTTQGDEINWIVYTGLTTYAHASGNAGTKLIPGLCTTLPVISSDGKTYTCTLRKGLVFSNGKPVVASDFTYAVERSLKIPWGGDSTFITPNLVGAAAYAAGKSKTISGISADDATGKIVMHLIAPYGPFDNVLAFPAFGLIPAGFPMKVEPTSPPAGVGPYMVTNIVPNASYDVVQNPEWAKMAIPGIPAGHANVDVKISSNITANALSVLNNSTDIFDWADTVPGQLLPQIQSKAADRFHYIDLGGSTYYIFLNSQEKPFSSQLAREAVVTGLNQDAMSRLGSGTLVPACFFLPPDIPGHPSAKCPYGTPGLGNLAKAKALVKASGMEGQPVTVWSEERDPRQAWMTYYTSFLNSIGFKATQKLIADATYFTTIGEEKTLHPQTGFDDWNQDFPNPDDFYGVLLDGHSITPTDNLNDGEVNDPYLNAQITKLGATPTVDLASVAAGWRSLDEYVAKKAYVAVFGYQKFPFFASDKVNYSKLVFQPIVGWDLTSFELK